jgi:branched-chain amino acid transport system ATP-binding protein
VSLLAIKDLVVRYGEIEAVHGVTLEVDEGQVVTLLGSNGAGKSTTLRAISGLIAPAAGDILFDGNSASNRRGGAGALGREADEMFELFPDIRPFRDALGWTLSGGQQQMVAVARGLMARPRLLLLDEPSLGLAPVIVQAVFRIISEIRRRGTTVLLVEQNARMGLSVADYGYVLETGRLALGGKPDELWGNEAIRAAYLGGGQAAAARV